MARPAGRNPRTEKVLLSLTKPGAAELDRLRGSQTRQDYLRSLLADASAADRGKHQHVWTGKAGERKCKRCGAPWPTGQ